MRKLFELLVVVRLVLARMSVPRHERERGDVPGWVLVTVMSATIVVALLAVARPQLTEMLRSALRSVG